MSRARRQQFVGIAQPAPEHTHSFLAGPDPRSQLLLHILSTVTSTSQSAEDSSTSCSDSPLAGPPARPISLPPTYSSEPCDQAKLPRQPQLAAPVNPEQQQTLSHAAFPHIVQGRPSVASATSNTPVGQDAMGSTPGRCWHMLPPELHTLILKHMGATSRRAILVSSVCRSWRMALSQDKTCLLAIDFTAHITVLQSISRSRLLRVQSAPWLMRQASAAGNTSASVTLARVAEVAGDVDEATSNWARAARNGHPEAQLRLGEAYHKGGTYLSRDPEEAMLWLSRSAKQLLAGNAIENGHLSTCACCKSVQPAWWLGQGKVLEGARTPLEMLAGAALQLAFLHLDGEAAKQDTAAAVRWFRVAAGCGCRDAEAALGTLYSTGQY